MLRALARIDLGAVTRNCAALVRAAAPAELCAVVKADGYGHGAVPVARAALRGGARALAVATAQEARSLRDAGIEAPLLVLGALSEEELDVAVAAGAQFVAWREEFVAALARRAPGAAVHVKLDTGMGRLGTRDAAEASLVAEAVSSSDLRLTGLMTHLASADEDPEFTRVQLERFEVWSAPLARDGVLRHAANSAATLGTPASRFDMVRCGIAVYGMDPFQRDPADHDLEPVLELVSYLAEVKRAAPGESAGYGRTWTAERETWVGTVPIGYGDGVRRALGNTMDVLVDGRRAPLVGNVSMDNVTVDLGPGEPPARGSEVVLLGARSGDRILAEHWARALATINYEVTCGISPRVPREYERASGVAAAERGP